jgi:hypothetical protein
MSYNEEKVPVHWYRSTICCAFLVAATAFTCPGIFGALNGLGAGGGASPDISNAANAIVFGCLAVGSLFVGAIANRITPKYALLVGTTSSSSHLHVCTAINSSDHRLVHLDTPRTPPVCIAMIGLAPIGYCSLVQSSWAFRPASSG